MRTSLRNTLYLCTKLYGVTSHKNVAFTFTADRSQDIVLFVRSRHLTAKLVCSKCHGFQKEFPSGNLTYRDNRVTC